MSSLSYVWHRLVRTLACSRRSCLVCEVITSAPHRTAGVPDAPQSALFSSCVVITLHSIVVTVPDLRWLCLVLRCRPPAIDQYAWRNQERLNSILFRNCAQAPHSLQLNVLVSSANAEILSRSCWLFVFIYSTAVVLNAAAPRSCSSPAGA